MRKRVILALMLVAALILTSGCSLVVKDAEVDKQTVIVEVAGKTFTKGDIAAQVDYQVSYMEYIYQMYGMTYDRTDASAISDAQDTVINGLIEQAVTEKKAADTGMDQLTDEELAEAQATVDSTWQTNVDSVKTNYFADTELTGEELDKAVEAKLAELGYATKDELLTSQKSQKAAEKLKADVVKDVTVSDDEIKTEYDSRVTKAQESYASNLSAYGTSVNNGETIFYTPAGYRYVKHILRNFLEADQTKITEINTQITDKQTQLSNVESTLAELGTDASADTEEKAAQRADLTATQATLSTEIADLQTQLDAAKEAAYAALQPTIDEINAKIAAGDDFDALMAEYGEDPGMKSSPAMENGYPVCTGNTSWVAAFTEASMALAKIGDVSPAVRSDYGIHIIKYVSDATEGATPLDTVKDTISSELLTTKQDALYQETVAGWVKEANAKIYKDRLAD